MTNTKTGEKIGYRRMVRGIHGDEVNKGFKEDNFWRLFEDFVTTPGQKQLNLEEMLRNLRKGDEVHVPSMGQLADSNESLYRNIAAIQNKEASVHFLKEGIEIYPMTSPRLTSDTAAFMKALKAMADFGSDTDRQNSKLKSIAFGIDFGSKNPSTDDIRLANG